MCSLQPSHSNNSGSACVTRPHITVIIPCFNESVLLRETHSRLRLALDALDVEWSFLFVDDGSTDDTWQILCQERDADERVRLLRLSRNFGHQSALLAGLDYFRGDAAVTIDADLQDPPEVIPLLVERWRHGFLVVRGRRSSRNGESWWRLAVTSAYYSASAWLTDGALEANIAEFQLLDRLAVSKLRLLRERSRYLRGLVTWIGFRQSIVEYERDARFGNVSKYTWTKLVHLGLDGLFAFGRSPFPAIQGAVICLLLAVCCLVPALLALRTPSLVVGTSIIIVILLQIMIMSVLCLVGEYIHRAYVELKQRPLYIVEYEDPAFSKEHP